MNTVLGSALTTQGKLFHFHKTTCVGIELHFDVTEHHPSLASKDVSLELLCLVEQLHVLAFLLPPCLTDSNRKAKKSRTIEVTLFHWRREALARPSTRRSWRPTHIPVSRW